MNRRDVRNGPARPAPVDAVGQLLELAEQLSDLLVPVQPDPNFYRRLKGELQLEAQQPQAGSRLGLLREHRRGILLGAAAVGSLASVVGVLVAVLMRNRHGRASHIAAS